MKPNAATGKATGVMFRTRYGEVEILPADNPWNQDISKLKVHPLSDAYVKSLGADKGLHPAFGRVFEGVPNGVPFTVVGKDQKKVPIEFEYKDESELAKLKECLDVPESFLKAKRLPAGWLIEQADLKGKKIGGAQVSDKHGNFLMNLGNATASDVLQLISLIKMKIRDAYGVQLEEEVQLLGF